MRAIDADAMIDRLKEWDTKDKTDKALYNFTLNRINEQPTIQPEILACGEGELNVQPEIIYCKDCSKHNVTISKAPYPFKEYICPLLAFRGEAQGHEFDYQFCAYGKKREVTE